MRRLRIRQFVALFAAASPAAAQLRYRIAEPLWRLGMVHS